MHALASDFAIAGHGGELGDQLLEQLHGAAIIVLGRLEVTQLAVDPAPGVDRQRQLVADLGLLGVGGVCPLQHGDGLVVGRPGLVNLPSSRSRSAWLFRVWPSRRRSSVAAAGSCGIGQDLLGFQRLVVERLGLALVGHPADQQVGQQGAGPGQRLPGVSLPRPRRRSGSRISIAWRYGRSDSGSRPSLRWMSPICW